MFKCDSGFVSDFFSLLLSTLGWGNVYFILSWVTLKYKSFLISMSDADWVGGGTVL